MRSRKQAILEAVQRIMEQSAGRELEYVGRNLTNYGWEGPGGWGGRKPLTRSEEEEVRATNVRQGERLENLGKSLRVGQLTDPIRRSASREQDEKIWKQNLNRMSGKGEVYSPVTKNPMGGYIKPFSSP